MPEDRLSVRLDTATKRRLRMLADAMELPQSTIVRLAVREFAVKLGVEQAGVSAPSAAAPQEPNNAD